MTNEELFDAYRQVVSQRDQLATAGDALWAELLDQPWPDNAVARWNAVTRWKFLRGIGSEPPSEDWAEC